MVKLRASHDLSHGEGLRFQRIVARHHHDEPIVRGYEVFGPSTNSKGLNAQDYFLSLEKSRSPQAILNHDLLTAEALFATLRAQNLGRDNKFYALNVSAVTLQQPDFADRLNERREHYGVLGKAMGMEITETGRIKRNGMDPLIRNVEKIHGQGSIILIDDAPMGASFENLSRDLNGKIGFVKLDKSVTHIIAERGLDGLDRRTGNIVKDLRDQGQAMIAEGIETNQQARALQHYLPGVCFQGHFFGEPQFRTPQSGVIGVPERNSVVINGSRPG
jgi:EAL domain-containing protein (putative c-di-GMP-specific phosphodiesterase class I)